MVAAQSVLALDWELALNQKLGYNVRQIKVGCRLVSLLAQLDVESLNALLVRKPCFYHCSRFGAATNGFRYAHVCPGR